MSASIRLRGVTKFFGGLEALRMIDIDVEPGEIVTVLGASGSGKTTLLRLIGGLEEPSAGVVTVDDASPHDARVAKRVGFVPQSPALLPWRTVAQNARLLLEVNRAAAGDATRSPDDLLAEVGLAEFAKSYPHELSGGMQQRVALVRAMALGAPLLLMDEPFAALDEITRADMRHLLARLCESMSTTIVFVTHSIAEAVFLSDRVVVLSNRPGRVVGIEPITLSRPATPADGGRRRVLRAHEATQGAAARGGRDAVDSPGRPVVRARTLTLATIVGIVAIGGLWELLVRSFDVREFILLPPSKIVTELRQRPRFYLDASLVTGRHALVGIVLALAVALVVGAALATSRFLEQAAQPVLILILVAPWVAYFASVVARFGSGDPPVLFLATLVCVPAFTFADGDRSAFERSGGA